jgi:DNA repair proteins
MGGLTEVSVDVRIVMREAVLNNATIMAICHNHPSGSLHPSKYDDMLTQSVEESL